MMENRNGRDRNNNNVAVLPNGVILRKLKTKHSSECLLCWKEARIPKCLCPSCSKQYCFQCIKKWLTDAKTKSSECPNCKCKLPIEELVCCAGVLSDTDASKIVGEIGNGDVKQEQRRPKNGVESGSIKLVVKVIENEGFGLTNGNAAVAEPMVNGSAPAKMLTVNGRQQGKKSKEASRKQQQQVNHCETNGKVNEAVKKEAGKVCNGLVHKENGRDGQVNGVVESGDTSSKNGNAPPRKNGYKKSPQPNSAAQSVPETIVQNNVSLQEKIDENGHTNQSEQNGEQDSDRPPCSLHSLPLIFFCLSCNLCICETCALHDETHAEHTFKKVTTIYETKLEAVKQEFAVVTTYLDETKKVIENVERNIDLIKASKARKLQELSRLLHSEAECIERQINRKLSVLQDQKDSVANEVYRVRSAYKKLEKELNACPKQDLLVRDCEFVKRCSQLIEKPVESFVYQPVAADLEW